MFKKLFIIGLCILATSCSTMRSGDDSTGESSDTEAYNNGMRYLTGHGVVQNSKTAAEWFTKSAEDGNPYAESELGYLYTAGKGVPQDYGLAKHWYTKAAKHGLASAQYNLGLIYLNGIGTPVNKVFARKLFTLSAQRGFEPARSMLNSTNY